MRKIGIVLLVGLFMSVKSYPSSVGEEFRYVDREYSSPGAHQLASWIASQLRSKELNVPSVNSPQEIPIILPYRLPLPANANGKRNSEVSNAIVGSEETQKMYRDGRK